MPRIRGRVLFSVAIAFSIPTLAAALYGDYLVFPDRTLRSVEHERIRVVSAKPLKHGDYWLIRGVFDNETGGWVDRFAWTATAHENGRAVSTQTGEGRFTAVNNATGRGARANLFFYAPNDRNYSWSFRVTRAWVFELQENEIPTPGIGRAAAASK